jgi:hypothetical protein
MSVASNIINGSVFFPKKYSDNELLKEVYESIDDLDRYNFSITQTTYKREIAFYLKKALGYYKQTHQLS